MVLTQDPGGCAHLDDAEFVEAFESTRLPPERFRHADHVRLGWIYLRSGGLLAAIQRYRTTLRRFAEAHGAGGRYHETITWAYLVLIHERLVAEPSGPPCASWADFAERHPDLLRWSGGALFELYGPEILGSDTARKAFVLPGWERRGATESTTQRASDAPSEALAAARP